LASCTLLSIGGAQFLTTAPALPINPCSQATRNATQRWRWKPAGSLPTRTPAPTPYPPPRGAGVSMPFVKAPRLGFIASLRLQAMLGGTPVPC
jgi:hypothetical protein